MKKLIAVCALLLSFGTSQAQGTVQFDPTTVKRVTVWDYPRTDSFMFVKDMRPILGYTAQYMPVYMLGTPAIYDTVVARLSDSSLHSGLPSNIIIGLNYAVDYVKDFSLFSKKQLRAITDTAPQKKIILEAFNTKAKYTIMAESPYLVYGIMVRDPETQEIRIQQLLAEEVFQQKGSTVKPTAKTEVRPTVKADQKTTADTVKAITEPKKATVENKIPPKKKVGRKIYTIDQGNKDVYRRN